MAKDSEPFFNPEWLEWQRRYIDALKNFKFPVEDRSGATPEGHTAWEQMLDGWWRSVSPGLPIEYRASFNHVLKQSRIFYSIVDQFARLLQEMAAADKDNDEWQTLLSRHFEKLRKNSFQPENFFAVSPLDFWQRVLSDLPQELAGVFKNIKTDDYQDYFQKLFALPGTPQFTAEFEETIRDSMMLWEKFHEKCREYHAIYEKLSISALDRLEKKILELGRQDGKIRGLRDLYNLWIDSNEEAFSECAADDHYSKLFGELVNCWMEIKIHHDRLMDRILTLYNRPTKHDMDALNKSQRKLRRQLNEARKDQKKAAAEIEKLKTEIGELRRQPLGPAKRKIKRKKTNRKKQ